MFENEDQLGFLYRVNRANRKGLKLYVYLGSCYVQV